MSLFDFLDPNKKKGPKEPRTLIAIDWDRVKHSVRDLSFLGDYQNPLIWIFSKPGPSEAHLKDLLGELPYQVKTLPDYENRLSLYLCYELFHEVFAHGKIHQVLIIAGDDYLSSAVQYLKEHDITSELKIFGGKSAPKRGAGREPRKERDGDKPDKGRRGPKEERKAPDKKPADKAAKPERKPQPPQLKDPDEIAERIVNIMQNKLALEQEHTLSRMGHLVKSATGSSVTYLIGQKGNRVLLDTMTEAGIAQPLDERTFKLTAYPTAEMIKPLIFKHKQTGGKGGSRPQRSGQGRGGGKAAPDNGQAVEASNDAASAQQHEEEYSNS